MPVVSLTMDGLLPRLLIDPWATLCAAAGSLVSWLASWLPLLPAAVLLAVGLCWGLRRWRRACLDAWHEHAHVVTIESPPSVPAHGAQGMWANLTGLLRRVWWKRLLCGGPAVAWEYVFTREGITIQLWVPGTVEVSDVGRAVEAAWPGARTRMQDNTPPLPASRPDRRVLARGGTLRLARPDTLPIQTEVDRHDPLQAVLGTSGALSLGDGACVQVLARPATRRRLARSAAVATPAARSGPAAGSPARRWVLLLVRALLDLITPATSSTAPAGPQPARSGTVRDPRPGMEANTQSRAMVTKKDSLQCETLVRYVVSTTVPRDPSPHHLRAGQAQLRQRAHALAAAASGYRDHNDYRSHHLSHPLLTVGRRWLGHGDLLSTAELAALAHLPAETTVGLAQAGAKALAPPSGVAAPGAEVKPLGVSDVGQTRPVGLRVADARHHLHVLGATGVGKSTLLAQMLLDDITRHRGVVLIDPKGDLVTDLLERMPAEAADRLVLFDPDQPGPVPCLNPLHGGGRDLAVDQLVSIFHRIYGSSWGPRTEDVFRSACLTLRSQGGVSTLADLPRLLGEDAFRARVTDGLTDPVLQGFWSQYESLPVSARTAATAPLMNKLRAFLLRPFVRDALAGGDSTVDMGQVLDGGICFVRIPKGQLGDETTRLFGSLIVASVWQAATARSATPHAQRPDATMVLDECQNFLNMPSSLDDMLAEARGYRLSLTLAHQHLGQLGRDLRDGIATNARNKIYFTAGPEDARELARHTTPRLSEHDLSHLGAFTAAARLVVAGEETHPFTVTTQPWSPAVPGRARHLRHHAAQALGETTTSPPPNDPPPEDGSAPHSSGRRTSPTRTRDPDPTAGHGAPSAHEAASRSLPDGHRPEPDKIVLDPDPSAHEESEPPPATEPQHRGDAGEARPGGNGAANDPRR